MECVPRHGTHFLFRFLSRLQFLWLSRHISNATTRFLGYRCAKSRVYPHPIAFFAGTSRKGDPEPQNQLVKVKFTVEGEVKLASLLLLLPLLKWVIGLLSQR